MKAMKAAKAMTKGGIVSELASATGLYTQATPEVRCSRHIASLDVVCQAGHVPFRAGVSEELLSEAEALRRSLQEAEARPKPNIP